MAGPPVSLEFATVWRASHSLHRLVGPQDLILSFQPPRNFLPVSLITMLAVRIVYRWRYACGVDGVRRGNSIDHRGRRIDTGFFPTQAL